MWFIFVTGHTSTAQNFEIYALGIIIPCTNYFYMYIYSCTHHILCGCSLVKFFFSFQICLDTFVSKVYTSVSVRTAYHCNKLKKRRWFMHAHFVHFYKKQIYYLSEYVYWQEAPDISWKLNIFLLMCLYQSRRFSLIHRNFSHLNFQLRIVNNFNFCQNISQKQKFALEFSKVNTYVLIINDWLQCKESKALLWQFKSIQVIRYHCQ